MIGTLTGKAKDAGKGMIIVETDGGVGYAVGVSAATKNTVLKKGTCTLHTHTVIRKDTIELFGFPERKEYSAFLLLITVSGIGPKKALTILEAMPIPTLLQTIKNEDTDTLISFGIGKKQAQRIILELQRKIETADGETGMSGDIIAALIALGYDKKEIVETLKHAPPKTETIEEQIQETLKAMRSSQYNQ